MNFTCKSEVICQKHSDHKQNLGVCSCCLRERLMNLSTNSTTSTISSSSCTYSSSFSSSSCDHSPRGGVGHRRMNSDVVGPFSFVSIICLKKSKSIAFVATREKKKNEGFWSKLIRSTGNKTKRVFVN
ncbi:hypothetical protein R3W88_015196 [Solanum pinnatisectum]|uniref:Uncharacterized protein n=1 Tax=Solanum pinnatisectum TaxID=50273 RepID=A0AAV9KU54_9SOLN|nr:hypothetical protein R3W88_015196 [Solanum pinnatisectum]